MKKQEAINVLEHIERYIWSECQSLDRCLTYSKNEEDKKYAEGKHAAYLNVWNKVSEEIDQLIHW